MAYFADLTPCTYFGADVAKSLRAVGWLDKGHDFERGPIDYVVTDRLLELLRDPWTPSRFLGHHPCPFCRLSTSQAGSFRLSTGDHISLGLGSQNLFVPMANFVFVAPDLIVHYMDAHEYRPPDVFMQAVLECPPMRSMAYLKHIASASPELVGLSKGGNQ